MLKAFALIALLHGNAYVLDAGLTGEDCIEALQDGVETIQVDVVTVVDASQAHIVCEMVQSN